MAQFLDTEGLNELWSKIKKLVSTSVSGKQDKLVSGTSIKTINSISLLGSGNIAYTDIVPTTTLAVTGSPDLITSGGVYSAIGTLAKITNSSSDYIDIQRYNSASYRIKIVRGTFTVSRTSGTKSYSGTVSLKSSMPASTYQLFITRTGNNGYNSYVPYVKTKATGSFTYYIEFLAANTDSVIFDYMAVYTA